MILAHPDQIREYTDKGYWGSDTLASLFLRNARRAPDAVALVDPPNRPELTWGEAQRLSYADLKEKVDNLAGGLVEAGIGKDDIVVVQLPNIAELVCVYLAAARIGAIVSPVPVQYRTHELRQVMAVAQPRAWITTTHFRGFDHLEMASGLRRDAGSLTHLIALGPNLPPGVGSLADLLTRPRPEAVLRSYLQENSWTADDVFTICWTSGTEAEPLGVPRTHNHWIAIAYTTIDGAELRAGSSLLNPFPMVYMSAIGGMLVPWLQTGGKLVMHHPLDLPVFLRQIEAEQINYTVAPPVLLNLLLLNQNLLEGADLSTLQCIGSGSAPLTPWMVGQWKERHDIEVLNFFGSNEGTAFVSGPREAPGPTARALYFPSFGAPGAEWSNRVAAGMVTKLVDPITRQAIVEPGRAGELAVKGPTIFPGYFRRPEVTRKVFDREGFFCTGDLFEIAAAADGPGLYRFAGRLKDLIIRGGMKISPREVEALIAQHPKVAEVAVIGVPDKRMDERVCAVIVPRAGQTVDLREIQEFLKAMDMASYKMPRQVVLAASLPRSPAGQVSKRDLRLRYQEPAQA